MEQQRFMAFVAQQDAPQFDEQGRLLLLRSEDGGRTVQQARWKMGGKDWRRQEGRGTPDLPPPAGRPRAAPRAPLRPPRRAALVARPPPVWPPRPHALRGPLGGLVGGRGVLRHGAAAGVRGCEGPPRRRADVQARGRRDLGSVGECDGRSRACGLAGSGRWKWSKQQQRGGDGGQRHARCGSRRREQPRGELWDVASGQPALPDVRRAALRREQREALRRGGSRKRASTLTGFAPPELAKGHGGPCERWLSQRLWRINLPLHDPMERHREIYLALNYAQSHMALNRRPGDWDCASCGRLVFAKHASCTCGAPKPGASATTRPGDWTCTACAMSNFERRLDCFSESRWLVALAVRCVRTVISRRLRAATRRFCGFRLRESILSTSRRLGSCASAANLSELMAVAPFSLPGKPAGLRTLWRRGQLCLPHKLLSLQCNEGRGYGDGCGSPDRLIWSALAGSA